MKKFIYKYKRATNWNVEKQSYEYETVSMTRVSPILKCKTESGIEADVFIEPAEKTDIKEWNEKGINQYGLVCMFPNGEYNGGLGSWYIDTLMKDDYYTDFDGTKTKIERNGLNLWADLEHIDKETYLSWLKLIQEFVDKYKLPLDKEES